MTNIDYFFLGCCFVALLWALVIIHEIQGLRLMPKVGESWRLRPEDPFGTVIVTVLDVRGKHVLYQFPHGVTGSENIYTFTAIFGKVETAK